MCCIAFSYVLVASCCTLVYASSCSAPTASSLLFNVNLPTSSLCSPKVVEPSLNPSPVSCQSLSGPAPPSRNFYQGRRMTGSGTRALPRVALIGPHLPVSPIPCPPEAPVAGRKTPPCFTPPFTPACAPQFWVFSWLHPLGEGSPLRSIINLAFALTGVHSPSSTNVVLLSHWKGESLSCSPELPRNGRVSPAARCARASWGDSEHTLAEALRQLCKFLLGFMKLPK